MKNDSFLPKTQTESLLKSRKVKILIFLLGLSVLLFAGGFIYLNQNQSILVTKALKSFNSKIQGEIQIDNSKPSLFENFPYISIDLQGVRIYPDKGLGTPIGVVDDLYVGFSIWDLLQENISVKKKYDQNNSPSHRGFEEIAAQTTSNAQKLFGS